MPRLELVYPKGGELFIFRWMKGEEQQLIDALEAQAKNPATRFDIYDAAYLSLQLADYLMKKSERLRGRNCRIS